MNGDFWTPDEWADFSNELAMLIPEDEPVSNPEGAQESILLEVFTRWAEERERATPAPSSTTPAALSEPLILLASTLCAALHPDEQSQIVCESDSEDIRMRSAAHFSCFAAAERLIKSGDFLTFIGRTDLLAARAPEERLCSQCGELMSCMVKIGTSDGWCEMCLNLAARAPERGETYCCAHCADPNDCPNCTGDL